MPMVCAWGLRATHQACIQHLALWRKATFSKETAHHFKWYAIPKVCRTQIRLILYLNWKSIGLNGTEYYWFCTDRPALYCFLFTIRPPNIEKLLNVHQGTVKLCLDLIEHAKKKCKRRDSARLELDSKRYWIKWLYSRADFDPEPNLQLQRTKPGGWSHIWCET